jgi:ATP-dependent Clp protease ATP-binding subunit ClpA
MSVLRGFFKPEFLNRLDEILVFNSLTPDDIKKVVDIQIAHLKNRLAERHIELKLDKLAKNWLATNGYSPEFGARPLKRLIVQELENPLAIMLLDGEIRDNTTVTVTAGDNGLKIQA